MTFLADPELKLSCNVETLFKNTWQSRTRIQDATGERDITFLRRSVMFTISDCFPNLSSRMFIFLVARAKMRSPLARSLECSKCCSSISGQYFSYSSSLMPLKHCLFRYSSANSCSRSGVQRVFDSNTLLSTFPCSAFDNSSSTMCTNSGPLVFSTTARYRSNTSLSRASSVFSLKLVLRHRKNVSWCFQLNYVLMLRRGVSMALASTLFRADVFFLSRYSKKFSMFLKPSLMVVPIKDLYLYFEQINSELGIALLYTFMPQPLLQNTSTEKRCS